MEIDSVWFINQLHVMGSYDRQDTSIWLKQETFLVVTRDPVP